MDEIRGPVIPAKGSGQMCRVVEGVDRGSRDLSNNEGPNVKKKKKWMATKGDGEVPYIYGGGGLGGGASADFFFFF